MTEPWCVILASREEPRYHKTLPATGEDRQPPRSRRDPLTAALRRAVTATSLERVAAVVAAPVENWRQQSFQHLGIRNLFVQPQHRGTGYEVLLALLRLESRLAPATPVLFLPADHIVEDEQVMTNALLSMAEWIVEDPGPVYLLGAVPQGPHDQLGYIVPWHDAMLMPTGVYQFVERPDKDQARALINAGGLWNTFIFGGTLAALLNLFVSNFAAGIADLRTAMQSQQIEIDLGRVYERLSCADFSQDVLARQIDHLNVLRLLRCGWWPLKPPTADQDRHL